MRSWINLRSDLAGISDSELAKRLEEASQVLDASWPGQWPWRWRPQWSTYLAVREIEDLLDEIRRRIDARRTASEVHR